MSFVKTKTMIDDELYRILFSSIERRIGPRAVNSIAVTSATKGEGKTTTVINLARVAARDFGKRVLLLEGDLKSPQFHRFWAREDGVGLYHILTQKVQIDQATGVKVTDIEGLDVIPLGDIIESGEANRSVLIHSLNRVIQRASSRYDYVFVDCPPILPLVDMQVIGDAVDGVIMVVQVEGPPRSLVRKALGMIPEEKVLGIVLNRVKKVWPGYSYTYTY